MFKIVMNYKGGERSKLICTEFDIKNYGDSIHINYRKNNDKTDAVYKLILNKNVRIKIKEYYGQEA